MPIDSGFACTADVKMPPGLWPRSLLIRSALGFGTCSHGMRATPLYNLLHLPCVSVSLIDLLGSLIDFLSFALMVVHSDILPTPLSGFIPPTLPHTYAGIRAQLFGPFFVVRQPFHSFPAS